MSDKVTAKRIRASLYFYCRYRRGWLCADEAALGWGGRCDMLVDTGRATYEIEIKISKSDLWNGEAKKSKHFKGGGGDRPFAFGAQYHTNKFYLCVPCSLLDEAKKWCEQVNPAYGIFLFQDDCDFNGGVMVARTAKNLHNEYQPRREEIGMRLCAIIADLRMKEWRGEI